MMLAPSGEKLGKRHGAVAALEYREQGFSPTAVLNYLVRFGWSHGDQEVFSKGELIDAFGWEACGRGDGKFDMKKFLAINQAHLKEERLTPTDEYAHRLMPFLSKRGLTATEAAVKEVIPLIRERATTFVDAADRLDFVFRADPQMDAAASKKFLVPAAAENLRAIAMQLEAATTWNAQAVSERVHAYLAEKNLQMKDVGQPARVALTGRTASPDLFDVIAALGKSEAIRRLQRAAADAEKNASS
jgi:glutamyl-tRNA synthetase